MKKQILGIFLLVLAFDVTAATPGWYGPYEVTSVEAGDNGVYFLKPTTMAGFPDFGCASGALYVHFEPGQTLSKMALAVGLWAQSTGKGVMYYLSGCSAAGYIKAHSTRTNPVW